MTDSTIQSPSIKINHESIAGQGSKIIGGVVKIDAKETMNMVDLEVVGTNVAIETKELILEKEVLKKEMIDEITIEIINKLEEKLKLENNKDNKFITIIREIIPNMVGAVISSCLAKNISL